MYILDKKGNKLIKASETKFSDQKLRERQNLQEWIVKQPNAFGEELLIIDKEFDGFEGTKQRFDLLAVDDKGALVIIENKLDDSGNEVCWQAIRYASACASLSKEDIIKMYQEYLGPNKSAIDMLTDFFKKDIDEIELNNGKTSQRIILVAGDFRPEVTSSVAWLRNFNMNIMCFTVSLYEYNGQIMVDFNQIIPAIGTEEYLIKIANKERDEENARAVYQKKREANNLKFWREYIEYSQNNDGLYSESKGSKSNWLGKYMSTIIPFGQILIVINDSNCRVDFNINHDDVDDKTVFDTLKTCQKEIDEKLPGIEWIRNDGGSFSRLRLEKEYSYLNPDDKVSIFEFFNTQSKLMYETLTQISKKVKFK